MDANASLMMISILSLSSISSKLKANVSSFASLLRRFVVKLLRLSARATFTFSKTPLQYSSFSQRKPTFAVGL